MIETNKVFQGNCIDVMGQMEKDSVELILTDIPYDGVNRPSNGLRVLDKQDADIITFNLDVFVKECIRISKGSIYIFCGRSQLSKIYNLMNENKLSTRVIVWEKTNPSPMNGQHIWLSGTEFAVYGKKRNAVFNAHCRNTVLRYPNGRNKKHPTEKNLDLFKDLIQTSSNEGDLVFDPCVGGGTTAVASKETGRNFVCSDISKDYVDIANKRVDSTAHQITLASPTFPTEKAINKDLTATQQVATPKSAELTSLNPNMKLNSLRGL